MPEELSPSDSFRSRLRHQLQKFFTFTRLIVKDRRFLPLAVSLLIGFAVKTFIFIWSLFVVETTFLLSGLSTHGVLIGVGDPLILEHYDDWSWYYYPFATQFLEGHLPYTPELYEIVPGHQSYLYPPFFLYSLVTFFLFPGVYSLVGGIVFFDLISGICLYLITFRISHSTFRASLAAVLYFLNPIAIWWTDFLWFAEAVFTTFLIISIFFLVEDQYTLASVFMALATMTKQVAVIFVPVLFIFAYRKNLRTLVQSLIVFISIILVISLPYLILMPFDYISIIIGPAGPPLYSGIMPPWNMPVPLFASFWFLPIPIRDVIAFIIYSYMPLIITLVLLYSLLLFTTTESSQQLQYLFIGYALLISLAFYSFFPRGIYKWYAVAIVPFLVLATVILPRVKSPQPSALTIFERVRYEFDYRLLIAIVTYFLVSFAFTWTHRWAGPGILFLSFVLFALYWFISGRRKIFTNHEFLIVHNQKTSKYKMNIKKEKEPENN
ncbi:MAG: hypothetical protein ACFFCH_10310 [Promethearchaeota archaeon]